MRLSRLATQVVLGVACVASASAPAAETAPAAVALRPDAPSPPGLQRETYRLWPGRAPGATSDAPAETPTLTVVRPQAGRSDGTAVVIAPGGGYVSLAEELEGAEPAAWFAARGVTAFILTYRVGATARLPVPLLDGARAIRFVRAHAADFHINPGRIGMMGFSAGGHLAASTAVDATPGQPDAADPLERVSSRPDFLILAYPWLEGAQLRPDGNSWYCLFARRAGAAPCRPQDYVRFAPLADVSDKAPPTFIYHTTSDELVPVAGSVRFYEALVAHHVPAELHAFEAGRHGSGLGGASPALSRWPELLDEWLRARGLIGPVSRGSA